MGTLSTVKDYDKQLSTNNPQNASYLAKKYFTVGLADLLRLTHKTLLAATSILSVGAHPSNTPYMKHLSISTGLLLLPPSVKTLNLNKSSGRLCLMAPTTGKKTI